MEMEAEFIELSNVVKLENFSFMLQDLMYLNEQDGYPLKDNVNFRNYYFVIEVIDSKKN